MNSIPVLGIPHYNRPDLTARCIASIDYPVDKLVIVDNSPPEMLGIQDDLTGELGFWIEANGQGKTQLVCSDGKGGTSRQTIKEVFFIKHPNAGVAGAWNEIIKLFPAPWWLISNNDIAFALGDLEKMVMCVEQNLERKISGHVDNEIAPASMIYGNHGASWFAITRHGVQTVGLFDENIFPAYLEDCDWSRRCDLLGERRFNVPDVHAIHGDAARNITGSTTIHSDPALAKCNHRTHGGNFDYYRAKWGGNNECETFKTPFNDPHWPVWAWRFDPAHRAEQQWPAPA